MCDNFPNIKVVEGNAFRVVMPLKRLTFESCQPIEEDIDATQLTDVVLLYGGVQVTASLGVDGVSFISPADMARGTYDIILTAKYQGTDMRAAYEGAITIVPWNSQSNAQQFVPGSPIVLNAAYLIGGALTDAELEALKEEYRERNAELAQATADMEAAKEHYDQLAEQLTGVAQEQTLTQGVQDIREDISHIDIDTTTLAKQGTNPDATNTAILAAIGTGGGTIYPTEQMTATTAALDPNKVYIWGEVASLDISLNAGEAGVANVYFLEFYSGSTPTTLTLPASVTEVRGTIGTNKITNVGIFNNIAYIA